MATTRTELRALLKSNTDQQLTVPADQDLWLNRGEKLVIRRFMRFFPGIFRSARTSGTTDANGLLSLDTDVERIERIEDDADSPQKFELIDDINERWDKTGYYVSQYDTSAHKIRLQIMKDGAVHASKTVYWYDMALLQMPAASNGEPVIPEQWRDTIATAATYLFYRSQGPSLASTANYWKGEFLDEISEAQSFYRRFHKETSYIASSDPDAGGRQRGTHTITS
jgi:hypothetical protein